MHISQNKISRTASPSGFSIAGKRGLAPRQLRGNLRAQARVVVDQLDIGLETVAAGELLNLVQQKGRGFLAVDAQRFGLGDGGVDGSRPMPTPTAARARTTAIPP